MKPSVVYLRFHAGGVGGEGEGEVDQTKQSVRQAVRGTLSPLFVIFNFCAGSTNIGHGLLLKHTNVDQIVFKHRLG